MAEPIKTQLKNEISSAITNRFSYAENKQKLIIRVKNALKAGKISRVEASKLLGDIRRGGKTLQQQSAVRLGEAEDDGRVQASPSEVRAIQESVIVRTKNVETTSPQLMAAREQSARLQESKVERAREEARYNLRPVQDSGVVDIRPKSKATLDEKVGIRPALPVISAIADATGRTARIDFKEVRQREKQARYDAERQADIEIGMRGVAGILSRASSRPDVREKGLYRVKKEELALKQQRLERQEAGTVRMGLFGVEKGIKLGFARMPGAVIAAPAAGAAFGAGTTILSSTGAVGATVASIGTKASILFGGAKIGLEIASADGSVGKGQAIGEASLLAVPAILGAASGSYAARSAGFIPQKGISFKDVTKKTIYNIKYEIKDKIWQAKFDADIRSQGFKTRDEYFAASKAQALIKLQQTAPKSLTNDPTKLNVIDITIDAKGKPVVKGKIIDLKLGKQGKLGSGGFKQVYETDLKVAPNVKSSYRPLISSAYDRRTLLSSGYRFRPRTIRGSRLKNLEAPSQESGNLNIPFLYIGRSKQQKGLSKQTLMPQLLPIPIQNKRSGILPASKTSFSIKDASIFDTGSISDQTFKPIFDISSKSVGTKYPTTPMNPSFTPGDIEQPKEPNFIEPPTIISGIGSRKTRSKKKSKSKKTKRSYKFSPSFTRQVFNLNIKDRSDKTLFTGLELR